MLFLVFTLSHRCQEILLPRIFLKIVIFLKDTLEGDISLYLLYTVGEFAF